MGPTICMVDVIKVINLCIYVDKIVGIMLFKNVCAHLDIFSPKRFGRGGGVGGGGW